MAALFRLIGARGEQYPGAALHPRNQVGLFSHSHRIASPHLTVSYAGVGTGPPAYHGYFNTDLRGKASSISPGISGVGARTAESQKRGGRCFRADCLLQIREKWL